MKKIFLAFVFAIFAFGDDYEVIDSVPTSRRLLGKNDRIEVISVKDPKIEGISCYVSYAKKGGAKEIVGVEEDTSDASVWCVQTAPKIIIKEKLEKEDIFKKKSSILFKKTHVVRMFDEKEKTIIYLAYSDRLIDGSPNNSVSAIACNQAVGSVCEFRY